jgi:hypothetical protein
MFAEEKNVVETPRYMVGNCMINIMLNCLAFYKMIKWNWYHQYIKVSGCKLQYIEEMKNLPLK